MSQRRTILCRHSQLTPYQPAAAAALPRAPFYLQLPPAGNTWTYETTHHVEISKNVGMSGAEIEAAQRGAWTLSGFDRLLVTAAEELVRDQLISDGTWTGIATRCSRIELMEVVGLVGTLWHWR